MISNICHDLEGFKQVDGGISLSKNRVMLGVYYIIARIIITKYAHEFK